ncbi:MAG: hypothetical protein JXR97_13510, partial [Planctomycetes bacterium]|nr:hypothetical protein [Planctomycetota bacterium]
MYYWLKTAFAFLRYRKLRNSLTLFALIFGVAALTFLTSLMVGITDAMIDNSVRLHTGHAVITSRVDDPSPVIARWESMPVPTGVSAIMPRLQVAAVVG